MADPSAEIEVPGLLESAPTLRPADVLTNAAVEGDVSAVNVGISCPHAQGASQDCTETMRADKLDKYGPYLEELQDIGINYRPFMVTCYGRFHDSAQTRRESSR